MAKRLHPARSKAALAAISPRRPDPDWAERIADETRVLMHELGRPDEAQHEREQVLHLAATNGATAPAVVDGLVQIITAALAHRDYEHLASRALLLHAAARSITSPPF